MIVQVALVLGYMVLTHVAVVLGRDELARYALVILLAAALLEPVRRGARWPVAVMAAAVAGIFVLSSGAWSRLLLFLPPVIVNLGLAWIFGSTLAGGRMPLVERFVRLMHNPGEVLDPAVIAYARTVTRCWTALLLFNATTCMLLAMIAYPGGLLAMAGRRSPIEVPTIVWTLFSDVGCYALTGLMFVVEYQVRKRRFPWQPYRNFFDFIRKAAAVSPAVLAGRHPTGVKDEP